MSQYGQVFNDNTAVFVPGINDGVTLSKFELVNVDTQKYQGEALDVSFSKDGQEISARQFPVNEANIKPREITVKGEKRMQTQEEAVTEAYSTLNSWIKHVVCNFVTEEEFAKAMEGCTSFSDFANRCKALLPANAETQAGQIILGYDNKGFLKLPNAMWVTGAWFSVNGKNKLVVSNRIKLVPPAKAETPAEQPADVSW